MGFMSGAGGLDVGEFAGLMGASEDIRVVDGVALGFVDGQGVSKAEVGVGFWVKGDVPAGVEVDLLGLIMSVGLDSRAGR